MDNRSANGAGASAGLVCLPDWLNGSLDFKSCGSKAAALTILRSHWTAINLTRLIYIGPSCASLLSTYRSEYVLRLS